MLAVTPIAWAARGPGDLVHAFSAMVAESVGAVIVLPHPIAGANLRQIADLAARHRLPAIYAFREFPHAGGLISYGPSVAENWRRAAEYADRIVKGMKPADLPVSQPLTFELVINLKTVTALGLTLPPPFLLRADEILQ